MVHCVECIISVALRLLWFHICRFNQLWVLWSSSMCLLKKTIYKWICTVQTGGVQGSAVFVSNFLSPVPLRAAPWRTQSDWWSVSEQRSWLWSSPDWWWYLRPAYLGPVEAPKPWQNAADTQSTCPYLGWYRNCVVLDAQSCLILCSPMDCSLLGSSVHGILQARILESVAIPFSKPSFWLRDQTWVSSIAGRFFTIWATREAQLELAGAWTYSIPQIPV